MNKGVGAFFDDFIKKQCLNVFRDKLGKVVEEDDKFVCYIDEKKLDFLNRDGGQLHLCDLSNLEEDSESFLQSLKVCKPICYVFDGIEFNRLVLYTYGNVSVIFKNCHFADSIILDDVNDVVFENNKHYVCDALGYGIIKKVLRGKAKNLKFINDNFYNEDMLYDFGYFNIDLDVDNLSIINTKMDIQRFVALKDNKAINIDRYISINVKNMVIENSLISATEVCLNCNNISIVNSDIIGKRDVFLNGDSNKRGFKGINRLKFVYNGKEVVGGINTSIVKDINGNDDLSSIMNNVDGVSLTNNKNNLNYDKVNDKLASNRKELFNSLMRFRNICEEMEIEKSITRTLKR